MSARIAISTENRKISKFLVIILTSRRDRPHCGSNHIVKIGIIHNKKPKYKCKNWGRQFVENPNNKMIDKHS